MDHASSPVPGFDKGSPWDFVIRQAVNDENPKTMAWWNKELTRKCDGYINQTMSYNQVTDDGSTLLVSGAGHDWGKRSAASGKNWTPQKPRKGGKGTHSPGGHSPGYAQNREPQPRSPPGQVGPDGDNGGAPDGGQDTKGKGKGKDKGKDKGKGKDDKGKGKGDKGKGKGPY